VKYLLDAPVLAAAVRGRLPVVLRLAELKPGDVAVSVVSRVEVELGLRAQPRQQARQFRLLRELLASVHQLEFGAAEAQQAVQLAAYLQPSGERLSALDLQVAATAMTHRLTLITDRPAAFAALPGLDLEQWR
jgi:tRNA(fMet)-specific endonuclease VapC